MNRPLKKYLIFSSSLLLTTFTCILAGYEWGTALSPIDALKEGSWNHILVHGAPYGLSIILFATFHEFGHYLTAKYYKVKASLPFYIPFWLGNLSIGTLGAVIQLRQRIISRKIFFDIGVAGPLAGYFIAIGLLFYGYTQLPAKEEIYKIHPEYQYFGEHWDDVLYKKDTFMLKSIYLNRSYNLSSQSNADTLYIDKDTPVLRLGKSLMMMFLESNIANSELLLPDYEMMHNPWILAGFFALLFTSLNLFPIGQLDGGHVLYALVKIKWHRKISEIVLLGFVFFAGLGLFKTGDGTSLTAFVISAVIYLFFLRLVFSRFDYDAITKWTIAVVVFTLQFGVASLFGFNGYAGWLLFALVLGRFLGVYHPQALVEEKVNTRRKVVAILALIIFLTSFIPYPMRQGLTDSITFPQMIDSLINFH